MSTRLTYICQIAATEDRDEWPAMFIMAVLARSTSEAVDIANHLVGTRSPGLFCKQATPKQPVPGGTQP